MYKDWQIKRWDTPVSDVNLLVMVSLIDDGTLSITVEAGRLDNRSLWRFTFETYPAYRNILEEYRLGLWQHLDQSNQRFGYTFIVANSPWIASFQSEEILLEVYPNLIHYVISTEDDVIEVIAPSVKVTNYLSSVSA